MPIPTTERKADAYFDRIRGAQGPDALASAVAEYVDFVVTEAAAAERAAIRAALVELLNDTEEPSPLSKANNMPLLRLVRFLDAREP